jgi:hypothetical protein
MALLGSAYAAPNIDPDTSLDQWVVMSGATNGAADALGASEEDLDKHRTTALAHLTRYATEHGAQIEQFEALFERGMIEGKKLVEDRAGLASVKGRNAISGFRHDISIDYETVKDALDT